jgi:hypothetical protein
MIFVAEGKTLVIQQFNKVKVKFMFKAEKECLECKDIGKTLKILRSYLYKLLDNFKTTSFDHHKIKMYNLKLSNSANL